MWKIQGAYARGLFVGKKYMGQYLKFTNDNVKRLSSN